MGRLFGRRVIVELGTAGASGKRIEGLRIGFGVQMDDGSEPNKAKLEIYNASRETVAQMQASDAMVRLLVGYQSEGGAPRLLFQGNPIDAGVKLDRRGPDRVLVIEAQDGGREYSTSYVSESYSTATTSGQLFAAMAAALGLPLGNVAAVVSDVSFPHGIATVGPVRDKMNRIAAMSGARWQIRDGALQVWAIGGSTGEEAVVFSASAGNLIGSPKPTDDGVEITALLAPTLRPGKPFRVESEDVNGDYVAAAVQFRGDSGWGREFYVTAKGTPL